MKFESSLDQVPVECLLLRAQTLRALRSAGILTLGQALGANAHDRISIEACGQELPGLVGGLSSFASDGSVDWPGYWRWHDGGFDYIRVRLADFDSLNEQARCLPVSRDTLGLTGRALAGIGYTRLGQLVDAMRDGIDVPAGVGRKKLCEFLGMLAELADRICPDGSIAGFVDEADPDGSIADDGAGLSYAELPECITSLSVDVLHVGIKSRLLTGAGVRTVGDLVQTERSQLVGIPGLGRRTVDRAFLGLNALVKAMADEGIDWATYCSEMSLPLLPAAQFKSGPAFVAGLRSTFLNLSECLDDEMLRDIVASRLIQRPQDQATLEEIAARHWPNVTRERVRQKEKKLLRQMAGALVWGEDHGLGVHFHPSFCHWWKRAADEFRDADEIDVDQFLHRLAAVWDVDAGLIVPEMPIILAIVTGEPQMPLAYRTTLRLDAALFGMRPETRSIPVRHLRLGRSVTQLEERGVICLGDLVEAAKNGSISGKLLDHLNRLAGCLSDGELDWTAYRASLHLETLPEDANGEPSRFALTFSTSICAMLERLKPTPRAAEIFRQRTSVEEVSRPTLEVVADRLKTFASTIKREETVLLEELNDLLVNRQMGDLPFWIDGEWLSLFRLSADTYRHCENDYSAFRSQLQVRLSLTPEALDCAAPGLWAILNGYPAGRKRGQRSQGDGMREAPLPVEPMRIRLRGFRRVH